MWMKGTFHRSNWIYPPSILILDGHFSHHSQRSVEFGTTNEVGHFLLPSHTSHFLQLQDVGVFSHFKRLYEKELADFPLHNNMALPNKAKKVKNHTQSISASFSEKKYRCQFS
ncbi:hypothetical protein PHMEG_00014093 [Phytophthora megakarya]|uniref:DDE-1 domain-containing protein n=1 Tax=Phytophthora megakarya TaxID=4795 RepID=A0A225W4N3_9STRA|nr:hypothetical protein PHMEG_00014093 [Phytophthora megakarya]